MRGLQHLTQTLLLATVLASCAEEQPVQYTDDEEEQSETTQTQTLKRRTFTHTITVDDATQGLSLAANATTFSIDLTGCASTHAATVTQTKAYLEVYEFDRNCLAKLTTFTLNGKTYTPKANAEFDTWIANDQATFEVANANPADELTVTVISTIANPVVAAGAIHYRFSDVLQGDPETLGEAVVRESASLSVNGYSAPNFSINQVELVNITATGNGEFRFQLKCNNAVTGTGNDILCDDVRLDDIEMVLVEDTYAADPTLAQLQAMFGGSQKVIDMATEAFTAGLGDPAMPNGGFITADTGDADVMVMAGTKPIVTHPNMIFVLRAEYSYTWFYINVTTITQSSDH